MRKGKLFPILGFSLLGLSSGVFTWYEFLGGREIVNYEEIVVLKQDVTQGTKVTDDNWTWLSVDKNTLIEKPIEDPNEIVGKEAKHYIPANSQLTPQYFADKGLVLKKGQFVAKIPVEWTLSVPDSIRRGDDVIIYSAFSENASSGIKTQNTLQANSSSKIQNQNHNNTASLNKKIESKVAYIKDSSNREVITLSNGDRLDGSAPIKNVEIITTPEEFKMLEDEVKLGAKLVVMYD